MKPSEQIDAAAQSYLHKHINVPRDRSLAELHEVRAYMRFVLEYLDEEHARRMAAEEPATAGSAE